jgi:hypothetical protein
MNNLSGCAPSIQFIVLDMPDYFYSQMTLIPSVGWVSLNVVL